MASSSGTTAPPRSWPWWRCALLGLSLLGLALAGYLSWHHLAGGEVIGCGAAGSCEKVLSSQWSTIGGRLPVASLAAGAYLAIALACGFIGPAAAPVERRLAWRALVVLSSAAAGSALWFTFVQRWMLGAYCPYCLATHATGLLLAAIVFWRVLSRPSHADARPVSGVWPVFGMMAMGLLLAGGMAVAQVMVAPPPVYRSGEVQASLPAVEARAVPLVGSSSAPHIVTLLFDYKCSHCQRVHGMLDEVIRRFDGKVAFVLCPAPLNNRCNPYIVRETPEFAESCDLARLGLAVWVAKREAFAEFDRWMYTGDGDAPWQARSLEAARARAIDLVGAEALAAAQQDPWIERYLQTSVRIYGNTTRGQAGNAVPKLVFGTRWVTPEPRDVDDLVAILEESLGVPKP